ncbi:GDSL esterase/lipase At1g29660-like [Mercurialis annua]|uniref:GDSL esterase/lipase At1g29660-like n=1 Tax=Mercurialis annua TaxID=3986 RepID=UPI0021607F5C|nr:GDSL esterase/lipase At1g29660-like [Mercurialis annua]
MQITSRVETHLKMGFRLYFAVAVVTLMTAENFSDGYKQVPCYFIFGDSLADNGNNNDLHTFAKVNFSPYGIDFPFGPTGRFTNGRTTVDVIAQLLGFDHFIPPFARANGTTDILFGLNYASGSAGIRNESGKHAGECIPFDMQLEHHRTVVLRLAEILGTESATNWHLSRCLYTVGLGNNDYINNYFLPQYYTASRDYTLPEFTQLLIQQYTQQIKTLYEYGARKIAIFGTGQLGCTPNAISRYGTDGSSCIEFLEAASTLFNIKLKSMVEQLNANITDAKFIYINYHSIGADSAILGFTNNTGGCCPVASGGQCIADRKPCRNRTSYAFWDSFHPTEAVNEYIAQRSYAAVDPSDAYPFDIQTLVHLNQEISAM